jgi:transcriptional regulator with XRE-family HTH domain
MKVNVDLLLRLRKDHAWSQEELALAAGLNLRTIQRIETEATASLQSMKALASAFKVNIRALEHEESTMLNELVGKDVEIVFGISLTAMGGSDTVKGKIVAIDDSWLKVAHKKDVIYINISHIKRIVPQ